MDEYDAFCSALPCATMVVQWGGAHVWKVGSKVFAIAWDEGAAGPHVTFKVKPLSYDILQEQPGCRPAPYLASRGMKWIQRTDARSLDDAGLRDYLAESHRLVAAGLSKKAQKALGLDQFATRPVSPAARSSKSRIQRDNRGDAP